MKESHNHPRFSNNNRLHCYKIDLSCSISTTALSLVTLLTDPTGKTIVAISCIQWRQPFLKWTPSWPWWCVCFSWQRRRSPTPSRRRRPPSLIVTNSALPRATGKFSAILNASASTPAPSATATTTSTRDVSWLNARYPISVFLKWSLCSSIFFLFLSRI